MKIGKTTEVLLLFIGCIAQEWFIYERKERFEKVKLRL